MVKVTATEPLTHARPVCFGDVAKDKGRYSARAHESGRDWPGWTKRLHMDTAWTAVTTGQAGTETVHTTWKLFCSSASGKLKPKLNPNECPSTTTAQLPTSTTTTAYRQVNSENHHQTTTTTARQQAYSENQHQIRNGLKEYCVGEHKGNPVKPIQVQRIWVGAIPGRP